MAFTQEQVANLPDWLKDFYRSTGAIETPDPIVESPVYQQAPYRPQYVRPKVQGDMRSEGGEQTIPSMPRESLGLFDAGGGFLEGAKGLFDDLKSEVTGTYDSIENFVNDPTQGLLDAVGWQSKDPTDNRAFANTSMTAKNIGNLGNAFSTLTRGNPLGLAVQGIAKQFERSDLNKDLARLTGNDPQRIGFLEGLFSNQEELARDYLGDFSAPESFDQFGGYTDLQDFSRKTGQDMSNITNVDQMFALMDAGFTIKNGEWTPPDPITAFVPDYTPHDFNYDILDGYVAPVQLSATDKAYGDSFDDGMFNTVYGSGMDAQGNADGQDDSGYGDDGGGFDDTGGGMDDPDY